MLVPITSVSPLLLLLSTLLSPEPLLPQPVKVNNVVADNNSAIIFLFILFPPFYTSAYDNQAFTTVFTQVCGTDENNELDERGGSITAEEVKAEDGSVQTLYTIKLKEGMKFHDGEDVTIDDLIFDYYVYADPTYDGMASFVNSIDIVGM